MGLTIEGLWGGGRRQRHGEGQEVDDGGGGGGTTGVARANGEGDMRWRVAVLTTEAEGRGTA